MIFTYLGHNWRIIFSHEHHPDESFPFTHCRPINAEGTKHGKVRAITTCSISSR